MVLGSAPWPSAEGASVRPSSGIALATSSYERGRAVADADDDDASTRHAYVIRIFWEAVCYTNMMQVRDDYYNSALIYQNYHPRFRSQQESENAITTIKSPDANFAEKCVFQDLAWSILYCGDFIETLGTTSHFHNSVNSWYYSANSSHDSDN